MKLISACDLYIPAVQSYIVIIKYERRPGIVNSGSAVTIYLIYRVEQYCVPPFRTSSAEPDYQENTITESIDPRIVAIVSRVYSHRYMATRNPANKPVRAPSVILDPISVNLMLKSQPMTPPPATPAPEHKLNNRPLRFLLLPVFPTILTLLFGAKILMKF